MYSANMLSLLNKNLYHNIYKYNFYSFSKKVHTICHAINSELKLNDNYVIIDYSKKTSDAERTALLENSDDEIEMNASKRKLDRETAEFTPSTMTNQDRQILINIYKKARAANNNNKMEGIKKLMDRYEISEFEGDLYKVK